MADGGNRGDFDDWFDEPEPAPPARRRGRRPENEPHDDPWVVPDEQAERRQRPRREPVVIAGRELTPGQLAIVGASAIALLLAILAAAGVFSGGSTTPTTLATPPATKPATQSTPSTPTTTKAPVAQAPTTTLKPGDTGAEVTTLQKALAALGYSPGKPDGSYGPGTKKAVSDFQTAKGLTADGVVGPKTLAALQQALSRG